MGKNGHKKPRNYAAEIAFGRRVRAVPPSARPGLLDRFRRAGRPRPGRRRRGRLPRTFWLLDPTTGEWRLL
jgi:hypothetical protein